MVASNTKSREREKTGVTDAWESETLMGKGGELEVPPPQPARRSGR